MADTDSVVSRGGGITSPQGSDNLQDLSSADYTLPVANMGTMLGIYNTRPGSKVTLPSATTLGSGAKARQIGYSVTDSSPPVAIFNGGTAGTHATLEAVVRGSGRLSCLDVSTAPGKWAKLGGTSLRGYPWWTGGAPISKALAAATFTTARPCAVMITSTLGAYVYVDASNNVQMVAFSLNADRTPNAMSAATQIRAGGATVMQSAHLIVANAASGRVVASWWDSTNSKNEYVAVNITAGNPPTIGTPGSVIDDSGVTAADRVGANKGMIVADGGGATDSFWHHGVMQSTTGQMAYHFTLSGTAITMNTSNKYNTTADTSATSMNGFSPASNKLLVFMGVDAVFKYLSYSAGTISVAWTSAPPIQPTSWAGSGLHYYVVEVDAANGWYAGTYGIGANNHGYVVAKINLTTGAVAEALQLSPVLPGSTTAPFSDNVGGYYNGAFALGDGEIMGARMPTTNTFTWTYYDVKAAISPGTIAGTTGQAPQVFEEPRSYAMLGGAAGIQVLCWDSTTRTLVGVGGLLSTHYIQTYQIPRR